MNDQFDVVVIGAGVGGLAVSGLCAKAGLKTLLIEQCDRVGGRAFSIRGEEIMANGANWYKKLIGKQYTWLPYSEPGLSEIIKRKMLSWYTLDVGYHGVALNGAGYFRDLDELLGTGVPMVGNANGTYVGEEFYMDMNGLKMDPRLKKIITDQNIPMHKFYMGMVNMKNEDYDALEKISVTKWCKENGLYENKTVFGMIHAVSTLITTINDPDDISIGDIFRYLGTIVNPRFKAGKAQFGSGFTIGSIIRWSQAVANRFVDFGGTMMLNTTLEKVIIEKGEVTGILLQEDSGTVREIKTERVVSNIPIQDSFKFMDKDAFPQDWADRSEKLYGYGSIAPYFGLNKLVMPEREWDIGVKDCMVIPKEEGFEYDIYMCWNIQSRTDPACAPGGKHLMTAYAPVTEQEAKDKNLMIKACKLIIDYLERRYPGFRESIDWAMFPTAWKLEGVAKSKTQAGTLKAPVAAPTVKGLYFAGDTVKGYGVAMDCAVAAGLICASEITGKDYGLS